MTKADDRLIVALDFPDSSAALELVDNLDDLISFYKIGMQLYFAEGNTIVETIKKRGKKIFLDLKINDIPETVARAVESVARLDVDFLTLFTNAGQIKAARAILTQTNSPLKLLNVTVLTSETSDFSAVAARAELSLEAGAHGLICSGYETAELRARFGDSAILVNPGIRPASASADDQVRIVTPSQALAAGASNLVIGRPITKAADPRAATLQILTEMQATRRG
ncbi:MAG: orotidine-5'-phosphate decarboxylase [Spirochaetes bacterium]|nr:orotidine-5'-phosphate decarboxylase [Spirochaetota bacterium]